MHHVILALSPLPCLLHVVGWGAPEVFTQAQSILYDRLFHRAVQAMLVKAQQDARSVVFEKIRLLQVRVSSFRFILLHPKYCGQLGPNMLVRSQQCNLSSCLLSGPFPCDICGRQFNDTGNLKRHIECTHGGKRKWTCFICGKSVRER